MGKPRKIQLKHLNLQDAIVLYGLQKRGPQTRLQLQTLGLSITMIQTLEKYGILTAESNPQTNITSYKVRDDLFTNPET